LFGNSLGENVPKFSEKSLRILSDADPRLQDLFFEVIKVTDCSIICSYRNEISQNEAYDQGFSKLRYPMSNHNKMPSKAIDAVPYPLDWEDLASFHYLAGVVKGTAFKMQIPIIWGGSWANFPDYPHYELKKDIYELV
jgi:peptidoglycan L-alanyl-D-glutamate endopeptidase CwlK